MFSCLFASSCCVPPFRSDRCWRADCQRSANESKRKLRRLAGRPGTATAQQVSKLIQALENCNWVGLGPPGTPDGGSTSCKPALAAWPARPRSPAQRSCRCKRVPRGPSMDVDARTTRREACQGNRAPALRGSYTGIVTTPIVRTCTMHRRCARSTGSGGGAGRSQNPGGKPAIRRKCRVLGARRRKGARCRARESARG